MIEIKAKFLDQSLDLAPFPLASVEGEHHIVRYINPTFCHLLHKARDQIIGKNFAELMPENSKAVALLDRVYRTGMPETYVEQEPLVSFAGFRSYAMWPVLAEDGVTYIMIQMTDAGPTDKRTVEMNEALVQGLARQNVATEAMNHQLKYEIVARQASTEKLAATAKELAEKARLLDLSRDAIIVRDLENKIRSWNTGAEKLYGWKSDEVIGKHLHTLLQTEFPIPMEEIVAQLHREGEFSGEVVQIARDGRRIPSLCRWVLDSETQSILTSYTDLTERTEREQAHAKLAAIVESSDDAILSKDLNGIITSWNTGAQRLFGYNAEETVGRSVTMLIPFDRLNEEPGILERIRRGEPVEHYETIRRCKDGTLIDVSLTVSPLRNRKGRVIGASKIVRDITKRKQAEAIVQQNAALFSAFINHAPTGMYVVDNQLRLHQINARAMPSFANIDPLIGRDLNEIHQIMWGPEVAEKIARIFQHTIETGERYISPSFLETRKDLDVEESYEWQIQRVTLPDGQYGIVCFFNDVSDLRKSHQKLEELVGERTAKLRATIRELEGFSYSITHDLRAPLRAMRQFSDILEDDYASVLDDTGKEYLRRIARASDRMDKLIQDVLVYSKVLRAELKLEPIDVEELLHGMFETYTNLKEPNAEISIEGHLPLVWGNEAALTQCFSNLLHNAVKFVALGIKPRVQIRAEQKRSDGTVLFWIEDNGIGIDPIHAERIFGMFQRLGAGYEGTGIGLSIVRKAAERMGGKVGIGPPQGKGSRFWLELRMAEDTNQTHDQ